LVRDQKEKKAEREARQVKSEGQKTEVDEATES
jgi:hypothetical protein